MKILWLKPLLNRNLRKQTGSVVEQGRSQKIVSDKAESAFLRVEDVADRLVHIAD